MLLVFWGIFVGCVSDFVLIVLCNFVIVCFVCVLFSFFLFLFFCGDCLCLFAFCCCCVFSNVMTTQNRLLNRPPRFKYNFRFGCILVLLFLLFVFVDFSSNRACSRGVLIAS